MLPAVVALLGAFVGTLGAAELWRKHRSRGWTEAPATIAGVFVRSRPVLANASTPAGLGAHVLYEYAVGSERHEGHFAPFTPVMSGGHVADLLATFPLDARVMIRYDPANPARSYFDRGVERSALLWAIIGFGVSVAAILSLLSSM